MNALKIAAIVAEVAVVSTLAVSSYHVAFAGPSPDWLAGAPILTVVALESMRLPLAFRLPRMRFVGFACGMAMLAGLSVITGEAAKFRFREFNLPANPSGRRGRARPGEGSDLARCAAVGLRSARGGNRLIAADVESARKHRADIDKPPELQAAPSGRTCSGKHGSWNCGAAVQAEAVRANAAAMKAHADELKDASALVKAAEGRLAAVAPAPAMRASDASSPRLRPMSPTPGP